MIFAEKSKQEVLIAEDISNLDFEGYRANDLFLVLFLFCRCVIDDTFLLQIVNQLGLVELPSSPEIFIRGLTREDSEPPEKNTNLSSEIPSIPHSSTGGKSNLTSSGGNTESLDRSSRDNSMAPDHGRPEGATGFLHMGIPDTLKNFGAELLDFGHAVTSGSGSGGSGNGMIVENTGSTGNSGSHGVKNNNLNEVCLSDNEESPPSKLEKSPLRFALVIIIILLFIKTDMLYLRLVKELS